jgi:hypothetical protein
MEEKIRLELLRIFSSMFNSKGLPDPEQVKEFLALECWKVNDKLSLKLLQIFSAMNGGKELSDGFSIKYCSSVFLC